MSTVKIGYKNLRPDYDSGKVQVRHQQEAVIFSAEEEYQGTPEEKRRQISALIEDLQEMIREQGGIVGHVKAYLEEIVSGVSLSGTGGAVEEERIPCRKVRLYFTAIAFQVNEKEICGFLNRRLA